jgi:hypothetical protein
MKADLGLFILDVLKDYKYDNSKTSKQLSEMCEDDDRILGLTYLSNRNPRIYIAKDQMHTQKTLTQLHEFSHVYHAMMGNPQASEDVVDALAQKWYANGMGLK